MNDFTKEELVYLLKCADPQYGIHFESVCEKLHAIIDNYCEHKETVNIGGWVSKCVKCGTKFGDETQ